MAVIEFLDYRINEMSYVRNEKFDKTDVPDIENQISFSFEKSDNSAKVLIGIVTGQLDNDKSPFLLKVQIEGHFKYNMEDDEADLGFEQFLATNSAAILYPYLRSTVSSITNITNEFNTYILPTINIANVIKHSDNL